jgi:hypothetical protein
VWREGVVPGIKKTHGMTERLALPGEWVRMTDPLMVTERGWHRVFDSETIESEAILDLTMQRIRFRCLIRITVGPDELERGRLVRGQPGAGAVICRPCTEWKDPEGDGCTPPHYTYIEHWNAHNVRRDSV